MAIVKVSELQGAALDWAAGYALNGEKIFFVAFGAEMLGRRITDAAKQGRLSPSTKWEQCGPLIDQLRVDISSPPSDSSDAGWDARVDDGSALNWSSGDTALIAICRAIVSSKLGDEIEVPDELIDAA